MADFRASWNEEKANYGGYIPPRLCRNTGFMLNYLLMAGFIEGNGVGLRPSGK